MTRAPGVCGNGHEPLAVPGLRFHDDRTEIIAERGSLQNIGIGMQARLFCTGAHLQAAPTKSLWPLSLEAQFCPVLPPSHLQPGGISGLVGTFSPVLA